MININELKRIKETPKESDISLELLAKFYNVEIANRVYEINFKDDSKLNIRISPSNLPHMLALHKYISSNNKNPYLKNKQTIEGFKGYLNLYKGYIKLDDLMLVKNGEIYSRYKDRILNFPFIYQILRNSKFLEFDKNKVINCKIDGDFLFVSDINEKKMHLFVVENEKTNYPMTFFTRKDDLYIKDQKLKEINYIRIKDVNNDFTLAIFKDGREYINKAILEVASTNIKGSMVVSKKQLDYLQKKGFKNIIEITKEINGYKIYFKNNNINDINKTLNEFKSNNIDHEK